MRTNHFAFVGLSALALAFSPAMLNPATADEPCEPHWDNAVGSPGMSATGFVNALTVSDDGSGEAVFAGGSFAAAGGVDVNNIAKWDGTSWWPLGTGVSSSVFALTVFDDKSGSGPALYAGGGFTTASGVAVNRIAKWHDSTWSPLDEGVNSTVYALTVFDDGSGEALYVGGNFTTAGGEPASRIAKWDGSSWSALGTGMNGLVRALVVFDDGNGPALYAGGQFTNAGGVSASRVAKWDGSSWSALGTGVIDNTVRALAVFDDGSGPALYAGGVFTTVGNVDGRIAKWDGSSWSDVNFGTPAGAVTALTEFDDGSGPALYAAGQFTTAGDVSAERIAKWDGTTWTALGTGVNHQVNALTVFECDLNDSASLYVGGFFWEAGGLGVNRIARWVGCPAGEPFNTPEGDDVEVVVTTPDGVTVSVTYGTVTGAGITDIDPLHDLIQDLIGAGQIVPPVCMPSCPRMDNPLLFQVETTATFSGDVSLAVEWPEGQFENEQNIEIFHSPDGTTWTNVTTGITPAERIIFGQVTGFSYIGVFEMVDPPVAICSAHPTDDPTNDGSTITVESNVSVEITLDGSGSFDPEGYSLEFQWDAGESITLDVDTEHPALATGVFPLGTTAAVLTATNEFGGVATCDVLITVQEPAAPAKVFVTTDMDMLWPPNHTMRDVQVIVTAIDLLEDPFEVFPVQVRISSNEPDNANGNGDGNTSGDVHGKDGHGAPVEITDLFAWDPDYFSPGDGAWVATIQLRAERAGSGSGRVYTVELEAIDLYNLNLGVSSVPVVVPRGKGGGNN